MQTVLRRLLGEQFSSSALSFLCVKYWLVDVSITFFRSRSARCQVHLWVRSSIDSNWKFGFISTRMIEISWRRWWGHVALFWKFCLTTISVESNWLHKHADILWSICSRICVSYLDLSRYLWSLLSSLRSRLRRTPYLCNLSSRFPKSKKIDPVVNAAAYPLTWRLYQQLWKQFRARYFEMHCSSAKDV